MVAPKSSKVVNILFGMFGVIIVVWRVFLDIANKDLINIGGISIPEWWWHLSLLLLVTAGTYAHFKSQKQKSFFGNFFTNKLWIAAVLIAILTSAFTCSLDVCSTVSIKSIEIISLAISLFKMLCIFQSVLR
jgi:uncharacterized membrane protein